MIETDIEQYLKKTAEAHGYLCYKFKSPGTNGVPDRILIGHGETFFVETKRPGEKPRRLQKTIIKDMKAHGATVLIIDTIEQIDNLFERRPNCQLTEKENTKSKSTS